MRYGNVINQKDILMGKHTQKSSMRLSNKINRSLTAAAAVGFILSTTTGAAIAAPFADETGSLERTAAITDLVAKAETVPASASILAPAVVEPVKASSTVKLSFTRTVVKTEAAPPVEAPAPVEVKAVEPVAVEAAPVAAPVQAAPVVAPVQAASVTAPVAAPVQVAPAPASSKGAAILAAARAQIGKNQDCTMLVTNSLKAVGINFHDWPAGYLSLGTVVSAADAQPGDLIYYVDGGGGMAHIAVKAEGNNRAIHGGFNGNQTVEFSANVGSGPIYIRVR